MPELRGMTVVLTRAADDNARVAPFFRRAGAEVVLLPCVRTEPCGDRRALERALGARTLGEWLVVTSRAGADAVASGHRGTGPVAAIGRATADRLRAHGLRVDFVPTAATGEALGSELPRPPDGALLVRSDRALPLLPARLRARGFAVREVIGYRTVVGVADDAAPLRALLSSPAGRIAVAVWSPSALESIAGAVGPEVLRRAAVLAAGPTTERAARDLLGPHALIERLPQIERTDTEDRDAAHR